MIKQELIVSVISMNSIVLDEISRFIETMDSDQRNMMDLKVVQRTKTDIVYSMTFSPEDKKKTWKDKSLVCKGEDKEVKKLSMGYEYVIDYTWKD